MVKTNTVVIHQPDFMPHIGFFEKLLCTDVFVVLDDVQFIRRGWHHRDKIKTPSGVAWLTVPVRKKGNYYGLIKDIEIENSSNFRDKHLRKIRHSYSKALHFAHLFGLLEQVYRRNQRFLIDLNIDLLDMFLEYFDIKIKKVFASSLNVDGTQSERLVNIVRQLNKNVYLAGSGSRDYLDEELFNLNGIEVVWQKYNYPKYTQLHGEFADSLSCLDFAMNCGSKICEYVH